MLNTVVLVVILSAIGILCKVPKWHRPFERRFTALEKKVTDESLEFRNELLWLLEKMEDYQTNTYNVSGGNFSEKPEVDSEETADGDMAEAIAEALIAGFRAEKEYVRRSLLEFEQLVVKSDADLSQSLKNVEKGLRDEIFSVKHALDREIASSVQVILDKEKSHADILKMLGNVENGLQNEITAVRSHVEAEAAKDMGHMQENLKAEFKGELNQLMQTIKSDLKAEIGLVKAELLDNLREFSNKTNQRICGSWHSFMDSCYFDSAETVTWQDARDSCSELGAYLAEVDSVEEASYLRNLAKQNVELYGGAGPWLGASDLRDEGIWTWGHSGRRIDTVYNGWISPEPNGGRTENCMHMLFSLSYNWNDTPCDTRVTFICEK